MQEILSGLKGRAEVQPPARDDAPEVALPARVEGRRRAGVDLPAVAEEEEAGA